MIVTSPTMLTVNVASANGIVEASRPICVFARSSLPWKLTDTDLETGRLAIERIREGLAAAPFGAGRTDGRLCHGLVRGSRGRPGCDDRGVPGSRGQDDACRQELRPQLRARMGSCRCRERRLAASECQFGHLRPFVCQRLTAATTGPKAEQPWLAVAGAAMESPSQTFKDQRRQPT